VRSLHGPRDAQDVEPTGSTGDAFRVVFRSEEGNPMVDVQVNITTAPEVAVPLATAPGAGALTAAADAKNDPKAKAEESDAAAGDMGPDAPAANSAEQTIPSTVPSTVPGGK
jgi:hypothetical protein